MPRHFSNWLKAYLDYTRDSEAPDAFHFWTAVSTVAGALERRVWLDMRKFQWTPNFYVVLVGPPGIVTKSTTVGVGFNLLRRLDDIRFGPESMTWQALGQDFEAAVKYVEYHDDSGELQAAPMSCLTISVSELGTFLNMEDSKMVSFLIEMWDGKNKPFRHKTAHSGEIDLQNPWLNIVACTTPSWLKENFPESSIGGGLTSRIVFVYAEHKRQLVAYPDEVFTSKDYIEVEHRLIEDLQHIGKMVGPYILDPAARAWGHLWYEKHWTTRPLHMASERYGGYISRKQAHIHKLAMILAASQRDKLVILKEDLIDAESLITEVEPDMTKVFESIGLVDEVRQAGELVAFVRAHKILTSNELWSMCQNLMPLKVFQETLRAAVMGGKLKVVDTGKKDSEGKAVRAVMLADKQTKASILPS